MENLLKEAKASMGKAESKKPKESPEAERRGVKGVNTASTNRPAGTSDVGAMVRNPARRTHGNMKIDAAKNRIKAATEENRQIKPSLPKAEGADKTNSDKLKDTITSSREEGFDNDDQAENESANENSNDPAFADPSQENQSDDSIPNREETSNPDDLENPNQPDESEQEINPDQSQSIYLAGDGDSIGAKVGQAMLHDDDEGLKAVSGKINQGQDLVSQWLASVGGEMISAGGDEFVAKIPAQADMNSLEQLRQQYSATVGATLTIGTGSSMSEAGKALIYGKLNGKDQVKPYDESVDSYLQQIHSGQNEEGSEEQKQDDHYIGSLYDDQDASQDQAPIDESAAAVSDTPDMDEELPSGDGMAPDMDVAQDASAEEQTPMDAQDASAEEQAPMDDEDQDPSIEKDDDQDEDDQELPSDEELSQYQGQDASMDEEVPGEDTGEMPDQEDASAEAPMDAQDASAEEQAPMDTDPSVASGDALDQDMAMDGEDGSDNAIEDTMSSSMQDGNGDYLKSQMMNVLEGFKRDKEFIVSLQSSDPETYQEIIGLLHQMIKVSKILNQSAAPQDPNQQPMDEMAQPQEEQAPPMMEEASPEEPQQ